MTLTAGPRAEKAPRRPGRTAGAVLGSLLLIAALAVEGRSLLLFHTLTPWSFPGQIHFCGRDYNRGAAVSTAAAENVLGASAFQQVARGPLWQPVYGHPATTQARSALGIPCAMVLYMRDGGGYRSYTLSGGP